MSTLSALAFLLIVLSSCAASSNSKLLRNEHHQSTKKFGSLTTRPGGREQLSDTADQRRQQPGMHAASDEAREKRSQRNDMAEYKDLNDILDDLEDSPLMQAALPQEFDVDSMPPLTYYLLLQRVKQLQSNEPTYRVRTPRLGRSIDFQLFDGAGGIGGGGGAGDSGADDIGVQRQFVSRMLKKSVPFKPRLGKRGQTCDRMNE